MVTSTLQGRPCGPSGAPRGGRLTRTQSVFLNAWRSAIMQIVTAKRRDLSRNSDLDLIGLVRGGDGIAFRAIMQRYNQRLYRVARGAIRDEAEAEDVLQEAYMRAF